MIKLSQSAREKLDSYCKNGYESVHEYWQIAMTVTMCWKQAQHNLPHSEMNEKV